MKYYLKATCHTKTLYSKPNFLIFARNMIEHYCESLLASKNVFAKSINEQYMSDECIWINENLLSLNCL